MGAKAMLVWGRTGYGEGKKYVEHGGKAGWGYRWAMCVGMVSSEQI